jgi:ABC transport system ATP-binding/permease protein
MDYPGCLVVITHDRFFMDKMVDHLFIFEGDAKIRDYNGQYSDYRADKAEEEAEEKRLRSENNQKSNANTNAVVEVKVGLSGSERKEYNQLEKDIAKLEKQRKEITEKFNDPSLSNDNMMKLSLDLGKINKELEEKEMRWLELADKL